MISTGPQGQPGLAGHQGVTHCCAFCTHFYMEREGNQSGFYGTCRGGGVTTVISHSGDAVIQRNCQYFDSRQMEEIVAERLAGMWLGKWRS